MADVRIIEVVRAACEDAYDAYGYDAYGYPGGEDFAEQVIARMNASGFEIVPQEPTETMIEAGIGAPAVQVEHHGSNDTTTTLDAGMVWRAMVEANRSA